MELIDGEIETKDLMAWLAVAAGFSDSPQSQDHLIRFLTLVTKF